MLPIEFETLGKAKYKQWDMALIIRDQTYKTYGVMIDLSNYYRADGAKITKTLSTLIRRHIPKEVVKERFAAYAKYVSELYTPARMLKAYWGDKHQLGNGIYEPSLTCYRSGQENETSRKLLVKFRRTRVLVLQDIEEPHPGARAVVYFVGGRNIILTNFYWRHLDANKLYFVEAIRRILNLKHVTYKSWNAFFLPIYRNRDSILVYDTRSKNPDTEIKVPCPHCDNIVPITKMYYEEYSSYRLAGCTKECARGHSKAFFKCDNCQEFTKSNMVKEYGGRYYCRKCQTKVLMPCVHCGGRFTKSYLKKTMDGEDVCESCATNRLPHCYNCGRAAFDSSCLSSNRDGVSMCIECVAENDWKCELCRSIGPTQAVILPSGKTALLCPECDYLVKKRHAESASTAGGTIANAS